MSFPDCDSCINNRGKPWWDIRHLQNWIEHNLFFWLGMRIYCQWPEYNFLCLGCTIQLKNLGQTTTERLQCSTFDTWLYQKIHFWCWIRHFPWPFLSICKTQATKIASSTQEWLMYLVSEISLHFRWLKLFHWVSSFKVRWSWVSHWSSVTSISPMQMSWVSQSASEGTRQWFLDTQIVPLVSVIK